MIGQCLLTISLTLGSQGDFAKSSSGASVKLKRQTNCKSANVIYLITCTQCGKQYVGETKRALNERMNGHRSDWTKRRFQRSPVAEHFYLQNHDFNSHVSLCCIDHDAQWSDWLVGCFGFNGPLRQYFSLYRAVSQREGERGK